jgi:hypothetical protein
MQCYAKCTDFHFFLTLEDTLLTQIVHRTEQHVVRNVVPVITTNLKK